MMQQENKRKFSRVILDTPVYLLWENRNWIGDLIDISLNGLLIQKPDDWDDDLLGEFFDIEIPLEEEAVRIRMTAHVAHEENNHIGFQCDFIDLDSMTSLKRLVELNVGDETILERELGCLTS